MMKKTLPFFLLLVVCLSSCYHQSGTSSDAWDLSDRQIDSISFSSTHHYSQNYNFVVDADSLVLSCQSPDELPFDSVVLHDGDCVVVADIMKMPADTVDTIWVKLARDQATQGWIQESRMLPNVEPDDPISHFISTFSDTHLLVFLALLVLVGGAYSVIFLRRHHAYIVHFRDIGSFYPSLLAVLVALSATLYASIQLFAPESWRHFYYHPTLNPLGLPFHLSLFLCSVWAIIVVAIATVDDTVHRLPYTDAFLYLCGLAAVCAVNYVVFSISTLYYVGYPLLIVYVVWAFRRLLSP